MVEITEVAPHSRGARQGIQPGDMLHSINGHEIRDVLDYRFFWQKKIFPFVFPEVEKPIPYPYISRNTMTSVSPLQRPSWTKSTPAKTNVFFALSIRIQKECGRVFISKTTIPAYPFSTATTSR